MIRARVVETLRHLVHHIGGPADGSEWFLFGSLDGNEDKASDIVLMILCADASQADALRRLIDPDSLVLPLHLSLLTHAENEEIGAVSLQRATRIFP